MPARYFYPISIIIAVLVILSLLAAIGANLTTGIALGSIFLLFCLSATSYTIIGRYRTSYLHGKISLSIFIRNICFEISAILLAMFLAAVVGRYLTGAIAAGISNTPVKLFLGIGLGLIAGWAIGLFIKFASSRLIKTPPGS
jgi:hypothetical protein